MPLWRATAMGLFAAALFGASAPFAKLLLPYTGPVLLAGILYLGAGLALLPWRSPREARLQRSDVPALAASIVFGGVLGPVLLLWGLSRLPAVAASLLLNLEAPLTIALAVALFGEHIGRVEAGGAALVVMGAAAISLAPQPAARDLGSAVLQGAVAIALACLCWALDNNLTARLSARDPVQVVRFKTLAAGVVNVTLGLAAGQRLATGRPLLFALVLGALGYGASLVLFVRAQRVLGAARQAALFATAPFVGALVAVPLLHERLGTLDLVAGTLMAAGVLALARARHTHAHQHAPVEHAHAHVHDVHHQHAHDGADVPATEPHSHQHAHDAVTHEHAHLPDAHHRHRH